MSGNSFTSQSQSFPFRKNSGGLNSTFSAPNLEDNEASDLQNIDFDKSGAIVKRSGYTALNTSQVSYGGIDASVIFLCHADVSAPNWLDSSASAHTITAVSGCAVSATASKFGGYSMLGDGVADFIYAADSDDFTFGTGDFTIDFWVRFAAIGANYCIMSQYEDANNYWFLDITAANKLQIKFVDATTKGDYIMSAAWSGLAIDTWYHVEVCRSTTSIKMFINGALQTLTETTAIAANNVGNIAGRFKIGAYGADAAESKFFSGFLDEIRVSKGIARHTVAFTVANRSYNSDTSAPVWTGLHQFLTSVGGDYLVGVCGTDILKMDNLDGTWDNITGAITITADKNYLVSFSQHVDVLLGTNGVNAPWSWNGTGNATAASVPSTLTTAKYVCNFGNYTFYANVTVGGVLYSSRVYWSDIDSVTSWPSTNFREVNKFNGQEITGIASLGASLVILKEREIWTAQFTGDSDLAFVFSQSRSQVGCDAGHSVQVVENGIEFHAPDGFYYFEGNNSYKQSYRITTTLFEQSKSRYEFCVSSYLISKNLYICSFTNSASGGTTHDRQITWDSFNNAWSYYKGINANCFARVYSSGEERIYFGDYSGYVYRMDTGNDDYPLNVQTAIDAFYYTKWFDFGDMVSKKASPQISVYYQHNNTSLGLGYAYNYSSGNQYNQTIDMSAGGALWDSGIWDVSKWAATAGGNVFKRHLTGRGEVVRYCFLNNQKNQPFIINGFATFTNAETNVK